LNKLYSEIKTLEEDLKALTLNYDGAMQEKQRVQEDTDIMQKRLVATDRLISGLSSRQAR
jgi:dynein heavy chain